MGDVRTFLEIPHDALETSGLTTAGFFCLALCQGFRSGSGHGPVERLQSGYGIVMASAGGIALNDAAVHLRGLVFKLAHKIGLGNLTGAGSSADAIGLLLVGLA